MNTYASNTLTKVTKADFAAVLFILLIAIASFSNYHKIISIFWLSASIRFFIFAFIGLGGLFLISMGRLNIKAVGSIDITIITFLIYTSVNTVIKSLPDQPSEDIYLSISLLLLYILLRSIHISQLAVSCDLILSGLTAVFIVQALFGIFQQFAVIEPYSRTFRAAGTFINTGIYGCFMALGLLLTFSQFISTVNKPIKKMMYGVISLVIFFALLCSGSRTSWLALLGGISCIVFLKIDIKGALKKYAGTLISAIGVILTSAIYFIIQLNTHSIDGRFLIWKISVPMTFVNPLTGLGYGAFFTQYGNYQAAYFLTGTAPESEVQLADMNYYLFNEYYKIVIEEGVIGFVLFALIVVCIIRFLYQKFLKSGERADMLLLTTLPIGVALLIFGIFSYPSQDISINIILLSVLGLIGQTQAHDRKYWSISLRKGKKLVYLIAGVWIIVVLSSSVKIWAIVKWKSAQENILGQEGSALHIYAAIRSLLSNNGAFLYNYGSELSDLGMTKEANQVLKSAANYGNSVELQLKLAENTMSLGDAQTAEQYYLRAAYMNPKLFVPFNNLLGFYLRTDQQVKARALAAELCKKEIKIRSSKVFEIKNRACEYIRQYEAL